MQEDQKLPARALAGLSGGPFAGLRAALGLLPRGSTPADGGRAVHIRRQAPT